MIFTRAKKSDAAYGAGRQTERTDYSSMDESKRYVSDKDGNPVSYDELIMRSRMAHEALFVEVMKTASPEMREAVANIDAVLAGKMDKVSVTVIYLLRRWRSLWSVTALILQGMSGVLYQVLCYMRIHVQMRNEDGFLLIRN